MQCYGDADVLGMMGFGELYGPNDINDNLGPEFNDLPEKFSEVQKLINHKPDIL